MKKEWLDVWRGLSRWIRKDLVMGCRECWVWSGLEEVGWSYVINYGGMEFVESGKEGEKVITVPVYLMEWLRGLVGGGEFRSRMVGEDIEICMIYGDMEWVGVGLDREMALFSLISEVGNWYWEEKRPSIGDINRKVLGVEFGGLDRDINFEITERDGECEIRFDDYWVARIFMGKWEKFILEDILNDNRGGDNWYHGRVLMLEGEFLIRSGVSIGGGMNNWGVGGIGLSGIDLSVKIDDIFGSGGRMN